MKRYNYFIKRSLLLFSIFLSIASGTLLAMDESVVAAAEPATETIEIVEITSENIIVLSNGIRIQAERNLMDPETRTVSKIIKWKIIDKKGRIPGQLYILYQIISPEGNFFKIDLFNPKDGTKINRKTIQIQQEAGMEIISVWSCPSMPEQICVEYRGAIDLFSREDGSKTTVSPIKIIRADGIETVDLWYTSPEQICVLYSYPGHEGFQICESKNGRPIHNGLVLVEPGRKIIKTFKTCNPVDIEICVIYEGNEINLFKKFHMKFNKTTTIQANPDLTILDVQFIPSQERILVRYDNNTIDIFDSKGCHLIKTIEIDADLTIASIDTRAHPEQITVFYEDKNKIDLFHSIDGEKINPETIQVAPDLEIYQAWAPNPEIICINCLDKKTYLFSPIDCRQIISIQMHRDLRHKIANVWIPNELTICVKYKDKKIDLFSLHDSHKINLKQMQITSGSEILDAWALNSEIICIKYEDHKIDLFNTLDGEKRTTINLTPRPGLDPLLFSSDNHPEIVCVIYEDEDKTVDFFCSIEGHKINRGTINTIPDLEIIDAWPQGNLICIKYSDEKVALFNYISCEKIITLESLDPSLGILRTSTPLTHPDIFCIQYKDKMIDLFRHSDGKKINQTRLQPTYSDSFIGDAWHLNPETICIKYLNKKVDLFNPLNGEKIITLESLTPYLKLVATRTSESHPKIFYAEYENNRIDLFHSEDGRKINTSVIEATPDLEIIDAWITLSEKIIFVKYEDNTADLFDYLTSLKINKARLQLDSSSEIINVSDISSGIICIIYKNGTIALLSPENGLTIKTLELDTLLTFNDAWTPKNHPEIICVQYELGLFDIYSSTDGHRISQRTMTTDSERSKIISAWALDEETICVTYENHKTDFFDSLSSDKIITLELRPEIKPVSKFVPESHPGIFCVIDEYNFIDLFVSEDGSKINITPIQVAPETGIIDAWPLDGETICIRYANNQIDLFNFPGSEKRASIQADQDQVITSVWRSQFKNQVYVMYEDKKLDLFYSRNSRKLNDITIQANRDLEITSAWRVPRKKQICILYEDNSLDLFDSESGTPLNAKPIKADRTPTKAISNAWSINPDIICVKYIDKKICFFSPRDGQKTIDTTLDVSDDKEIIDICTPAESPEIICVKYADNTVDFLNSEDGHKTDMGPITVEDKMIVRVWTSTHNPEITCVKYDDNEVNLFQNKRLIAHLTKDLDLEIVDAWLTPNRQQACVLYSNNEIDLYCKRGYETIESRIQAREGLEILSVVFSIENPKQVSVLYEDNQIDLFDLEDGTKINTETIQTTPGLDVIDVWTWAPTTDSEHPKDPVIICVKYEDEICDLFNINSSEKICENIHIQHSIISGLIKSSDTEPSDRHQFCIVTTRDQKAIVIDIELLEVLGSPTVGLLRRDGTELEIPTISDCTEKGVRRYRGMSVLGENILVVHYGRYFNLFHIPTGKKLNRKEIRMFNIVENETEKDEYQSILYIAYRDSTLDAIDIDSATRLNKRCLHIEPKKTIVGVFYNPKKNALMVLYRDNKPLIASYVDIFNLTNGRKINSELITVPARPRDISVIDEKPITIGTTKGTKVLIEYDKRFADLDEEGRREIELDALETLRSLEKKDLIASKKKVALEKLIRKTKKTKEPENAKKGLLKLRQEKLKTLKRKKKLIALRAALGIEASDIAETSDSLEASDVIIRIDPDRPITKTKETIYFRPIRRKPRIRLSLD